MFLFHFPYSLRSTGILLCEAAGYRRQEKRGIRRPASASIDIGHEEWQRLIKEKGCPMKWISSIVKFLGGLRAGKDSKWEGIRCASDHIEPSAAAREAAERIGFMPRWHSLIEHGPHAGSWTIAVVLGTISGSRTAEAVAVEHILIQKAGGTVFGGPLSEVGGVGGRAYGSQTAKSGYQKKDILGHQDE